MPKRNRYGVYGIGDGKSKEWFIYDRVNKWLVPGYRSKLKREAQAEAKWWNERIKKEVIDCHI